MNWSEFFVSVIIFVGIILISLLFTGDILLSLSISVVLGYVEFRIVPLLKSCKNDSGGE